MKLIRLGLLGAFLVLFLCLTALAETEGPFCCQIEKKTTDWTENCYVDKFDSSKGVLQSVTVTIESCGYQDFSLDSEDSSARTFTVTSTGSTTTTMPDGSTVDLVLTPQVQVYDLSADSDGWPPDFIGDDAFSFSISDCQNDEIVINDASGLAYFIGAGEQVNFETFATGAATVAGGGAYLYQVNTQIETEICVTYVYQPYLCIRGSKINDCTEMGLEGWTITLKDAAGNPIDTTTTGADGSYEFCNLLPGSYQVCETVEAGWTPVGDVCIPVELIDADAADRDFRNRPLLCIKGKKLDACTGEGLADWEIFLTGYGSTTTGADGSYEFCNLEPGLYEVCEELRAGWTPVGPTCIQVELDCENAEGRDFENIPPMCIEGYKLNACTGEPISGWEIFLKDDTGTTISSKFTEADGSYEFCDLRAGSYEVSEEIRTGWTPDGPTTIPVTLVCEDATDVNFENIPPLCIEGYKLDACDGSGLEDWTIKLYSEYGLEMASVTTGLDGKYSFCNLVPGTYTVCEIPQDGWTPVGEPCQEVTLVCEDETDVNFENKPTHCISGSKINDADGLGLEGWTITLTKPDGTTETTTTDANGAYSFCGLLDGTYTVCETMQDGWTPVGETCITVPLDCEDSTGNDFVNAPEEEEQCETAWAKIEPSTCFPGTGNWGWYTMIPGGTITPEAPYSEEGAIWAGAAKCDLSKGTMVGTAYVTLTATELHVATDLLDSCEAEDMHIWVGYGYPSGPVGRYPYRDADVTLRQPLDTSEDIYIAVHWGDMCCSKCFFDGTCS